MIDLKELRQRAIHKYGASAAEVIELLDMLDAAKLDAARYQWLRRWKGQEHEPPFTVQHDPDGTLWGADLDHYIDAAMAATKGEQA